MDSVRFDRKKLGVGALGEALKVLGLLASVYPDEMASEVDALARVCCDTLTANVNSKDREDAELSVMAGCFSCLDRVLLHFDAALVAPVELLRCAAAAVSAVEDDMSRCASIPPSPKRSCDAFWCL